MHLRTRLTAVVIAVLSLAGCAGESSKPAESPAPQPSVAVPADGIKLTDRGYKNGPPSFSLPADAAVIDRVDQPNVTTMVFSDRDAARVLQYLRKNLVGMGFRIDADRNDSIIFSNSQYRGAFTSAGGIAGLTIRTASTSS